MDEQSVETAQPECVIGGRRTYCHLRGVRRFPRHCEGVCDLQPEPSSPPGQERA